nr:MAG TPA: hypothetical protein [Bacteriophage sp.]
MYSCFNLLEKSYHLIIRELIIIVVVLSIHIQICQSFCNLCIRHLVITFSTLIPIVYLLSFRWS